MTPSMVLQVPRHAPLPRLTVRCTIGDLPEDHAPEGGTAEYARWLHPGQRGS